MTLSDPAQKTMRQASSQSTSQAASQPASKSAWHSPRQSSCESGVSARQSSVMPPANSTSPTWHAAWQSYRERTEFALASRLPEANGARLAEAMRYACLDGGKRFRAMLVYACGELAGATLVQLDVPAAAVEMMHAYSLVHDDLPAMDDDDLRRGRATCHIAFDQATAILAGDALQSLAFEILSTDSNLALPDARRLRMVETLARAVGVAGMAGGQAMDMAATDSLDDALTDSPIDVGKLRAIHEHKTGALIRTAARLGGLCAPQVDENRLARLDDYAAAVGLAFQIADDVLDATAAADTLGKGGGADSRMKKATYVSLLGVDRARREAEKLCHRALETAESFGDNKSFFRQLAQFAVNRNF